MWYHEHIGGGRCPIVDTWWQTETGGHHDQPAARVHHHKPGSATFPLPGIGAEVVDDARQARSSGAAATSRSPARGRACCAASGATRSATGRPTGAASTGRYFAGDGAKLDDDGYLWLLGRVDDVMNVSGHRISTTEVESALVSHPSGGRGGRRRRQRRHHRARRSSPTSPCAAAPRPATSTARCCASTSPTRSAPSPGRRRSSSRRTCPRPAAARSCAGCCATWPRAATSATPPRWPTPRGRRDPHPSRHHPSGGVARTPVRPRCCTFRSGRPGSARPGNPVMLPVGSPRCIGSSRGPAPVAVGRRPRRGRDTARAAGSGRRGPGPAILRRSRRPGDPDRGLRRTALPRLRRRPRRPPPAGAARHGRLVDPHQRHVQHPGLVREPEPMADRPPVLGR